MPCSVASGCHSASGHTAAGLPLKGVLVQKASTTQSGSFMRPPVKQGNVIRQAARSGWMEPRITLITLGVSDLERSIRFYRDGLKLPMRDGTQGVAFFETGGTWLALFPRSDLAH